MKYYAKFLPLAVGFSIILYGLRSYMSADGLSLQHYIVYNHCGELIKFTTAEMVLRIRNLLPYYTYAIIFSTYIYRHFCYSSVYIFSRCQKRGWWFRGEAVKLLGYTVIYVILLNISALPIVMMRYQISIDNVGFKFLVVHILVMSLWLYGITIFANILAILFGSKVMVIGTFLLQILLFMSVGNVSVGETKITKILKIKFNLNFNMQMLPALHKFRGMNKDIIDGLGISIKYQWSVLYMLIVNVIIIAIGTVIINRIDIIDTDKEVD